MRIIHIIDTLGTGGAERLLVGVIKNTPQWEHHVITLADEGSLRHELPPNCRYQSLGFRSKLDIWRCCRFIRKYIREKQINLVHSHLVMSHLVARLSTPRNVRLINSLHNLNGEKLFRRPFSIPTLLEKLTYKKRHLIMAVSQAVLDDYNKFIGVKGKAFVLHNFVEDRFFSDMPKAWHAGGKLKLIAVGTLKDQKNYQFLIRAMASAPQGVSLDIYGDGPLRSSLEKEIKALASPVRLMGNHQAIHAVLRDYDLYVMSSLHEGHPIALVEAMASGLAALVSDIPVLHEAMGDGGLYFGLGDPGDLLTKIRQIFEGQIDLNKYANYNWKLAQSTARKQQYLEKLTEVYTYPHSTEIINKKNGNTF